MSLYDLQVKDKGKKSVDLSFVTTHKKNYPELETAKCECAGKRAHSKTCGCMSHEFLGRAKSNHFSALKQSGNDPEEYASRVRILGKYHSRDIHEWTGDDGKTYRCPWHPIHVCSCGNCGGKERQIDSVDSEDSEAGSRVSGRQVVQDKTMEDSDDSDNGDNEGCEASEDSDGDYNTVNSKTVTFGTGSKCPFYRGVRLIEVSTKREPTVPTLRVRVDHTRSGKGINM